MMTLLLRVLTSSGNTYYQEFNDDRTQEELEEAIQMSIMTQEFVRVGVDVVATHKIESYRFANQLEE